MPARIESWLGNLCSTSTEEGYAIKAWFKSKTADKALAPIRDALVDQIPAGCRLLEVGCGTGDLLFKAAHKIESGVGIDTDPAMIRFAQKRQARNTINAIEFIQQDIDDYLQRRNIAIDIATSTLCLHTMPCHKAATTLKTLAAKAPTLLIADYSVPKERWSRIAIELDEMISGHYSNFKDYRRCGYLPFLAKKAELQILETKQTSIDGIKIWTLSRERR